MKSGKPLLCIHGFNVQPESHLTTCCQHKDKFTKFTLIPVIWPSKGGVLNYFQDREGGSKCAGRALKKCLVEYGGMFPRKSLLAHSMGNRMLRFAADSKFEFDNIFMAAADVNGNMFNKKYIKNWKEVDRREDGLILKDMLHGRGKIYALQNKRDYALTGSTITKIGTPRLGSATLKEKDFHDDLKGTVETKNAGSWLSWKRKFVHSYQFDDEAIDFYESKFYTD